MERKKRKEGNGREKGMNEGMEGTLRNNFLVTTLDTKKDTWIYNYRNYERAYLKTKC